MPPSPAAQPGEQCPTKRVQPLCLFERDDHGKAEAAGPSSDTRSKPLGTHMLTVPSHHPHAREMRRSASEQSPNASHSTHMTETRSKSFDYGSLS